MRSPVAEVLAAFAAAADRRYLFGAQAALLRVLEQALDQSDLLPELERLLAGNTPP